MAVGVMEKALYSSYTRNFLFFTWERNRLLTMLANSSN